jgi:hypothetical protein
MKARRGLLWWVICAATFVQADDAVNALRGQRLFQGDAPLAARIFGQDFDLPREASRCVNCHQPTGTAASSAIAITQPFGPPLSAALLTQPERRRGGPPSRYDAASLCTLLRSGVDPAHVIILRSMPRYEISDADCRSLWLHLTPTPAR